MSPYLDPLNEAFVKATADLPAPHELSPEKAFLALEALQTHERATDIDTETVHVPAEDGSFTEVVIFRPKTAKKPCNMVFYSHGGGWIMGSAASFAPLMEDFARHTGAAMVFPNYTHSPKQRFPYQYEQMYNVLRYFVQNASKHGVLAESIALAGDSVGGHMSIAMMQMSLQRGLSVNIGQMILFYPVTVTDTHSDMASYTTFKDGPFLPAATQDWMIDTCIPDKSLRETPLASPLRFLADEVLARFAPTTIILATVDPLLDEGLAFGKRLQKVGVDTSIIKAEGQIHAFILVKPVRQSAASRAMIELAASKMRQAFILKQPL